MPEKPNNLIMGFSSSSQILVALAVIGLLVVLWGAYADNQRETSKNIASAVLVDFVSQNLRSDYHPEKIEANGSNMAYLTVFYYYWDAEDTTFVASLHENTNGSGIRKLVLSAQLDTILQNPSDSDYTNLSRTFYPNAKDGWRCRSVEVESRQLCESMWTTGTSKFGAAVISFPTATFVQLCEIPIGSEIYDSETCTIFE